MSGGKVIIEARVNEYEMRGVNPNIPWTPDEIAADAAACREAGASIVHFHAREADGAPSFGFEAYRDVIAAVRDRSDILVHSTLGGLEQSGSPKDRISHIVKLAEAGYRPDLAPLDMGTTNVDFFDPERRTFVTEDAIYPNTTGTLRHFAETLRGLGAKPSLQIYNVPMLRWTDAFVQAGILEGPLYLNLLLTGEGFLAAHPATMKGLAALRDFIPEGIDHQWSVTMAGVSPLSLASAILAEGGNIALGLGDYSFTELGKPTNAEIVGRVAQMAREAGREVATPAEARIMLGVG